MTTRRIGTHVALLLLAVGMFAAVDVASAKPGPAAVRGPDGLVLGVSPITDDAGLAIGFHVEVVNASARAVAVVVTRDAPVCRVVLAGAGGAEPAPPVADAPREDAAGPRGEHVWDVFQPFTSHSWFLPIPRDVAGAGGERRPTAKGRSLASVRFVAPYVVLEGEAAPPAKDEAHRTVDMAVSGIVVEVDPAALTGVDLVDAYRRSGAGVPPAPASTVVLTGPLAVSDHVEDAALKATPVVLPKGEAVGFRVEIINPQADKKLVVALRDDVSEMSRIDLFDSNGRRLTPPMEPRATKKQLTPAQVRFGVILPRTSHAWFVGVPTKVRDGDQGYGPIARGRYVARAMFHAAYFLCDQWATVSAQGHEYRTVRLARPGIPVDIDPAALRDADPLGSYITNVLR